MPEIIDAHGQYVYIRTEGRGVVRVHEDALEEFAQGMGVTLQDLEYTRGMVVNGEVTRIRGELDYVVSPSQIQRVDTLNLKLGGFDDARELQERYRENFYKGKAEQIDRIYVGYETGKAVSEDIKETYLDEDGNVAADVTTLGSEFETRGGTPSEADIQEAHQENQSQQEQVPDEDDSTDEGTDDSSQD